MSARAERIVREKQEAETVPGGLGVSLTKTECIKWMLRLTGSPRPHTSV